MLQKYANRFRWFSASRLQSTQGPRLDISLVFLLRVDETAHALGGLPADGGRTAGDFESRRADAASWISIQQIELLILNLPPN